MSTSARKARKRAGIKFTKPAKVGTPFAERAWFAALIPGVRNGRHAMEQVSRSSRKRVAALEARGLSPEAFGLKSSTR